MRAKKTRRKWSASSSPSSWTRAVDATRSQNSTVTVVVPCSGFSISIPATPHYLARPGSAGFIRGLAPSGRHSRPREERRIHLGVQAHGIHEHQLFEFPLADDAVIDEFERLFDGL